MCAWMLADLYYCFTLPGLEKGKMEALQAYDSKENHWHAISTRTESSVNQLKEFYAFDGSYLGKKVELQHFLIEECFKRTWNQTGNE